MMGMRALSAALALALLAGCASRPEGPETVGIAEALRGEVQRRLGRQPAAPDPRTVLTPALLAQANQPTLLMVVRATDQAAVLVPAATGADGTVQWRDSNQRGLLTRGGLLVGTRGLGHDLMTVDDSGLRAALIAGGARDVPRVERRLRSDSRMVRTALICDVLPVDTQRLVFYGQAYDTRIFEERCTGDVPAFVNRYWIDARGAVRRSEVLVSPEVGVLEINALRD